MTSLEQPLAPEWSPSWAALIRQPLPPPPCTPALQPASPHILQPGRQCPAFAPPPAGEPNWWVLVGASLVRGGPLPLLAMQWLGALQRSPPASFPPGSRAWSRPLPPSESHLLVPCADAALHACAESGGSAPPRSLGKPLPVPLHSPSCSSPGEAGLQRLQQPRTKLWQQHQSLLRNVVGILAPPLHHPPQVEESLLSTQP
mmetsp:Transcript_54819/g.130725  ORF Transcript_54819/g.130725 Transcript_54819/m.130725 type:complete len:201 (-) Transcript_54819:85-687(-)